VTLDGTIPDDEVFQMIDHSYEVVVAKLPKYIKSEIKELK
jgi:predicted DNA-binding protein (MmcQ/YjbR family)